MIKGNDTSSRLEKVIENVHSIEEATLILYLVKERLSQDVKEKRFSLYPFQERAKYERANNMLANFWSASAIDFRNSLNDFLSLTPEQQQPLKRIFAFFSNMDAVAADVITTSLIQMSETFEEVAFYLHQGSNEVVHAETYSNMINDLIEDAEERKENSNAVFRYQYIREINEWIQKQLFACEGKKRLYLALVFMELCMFTPLFCIIFWYKVRFPGKLMEVMESNEYISRDESLHGINGIQNYCELPESEKYQTEEEVQNIFLSGMKVMENFVRKDIFKDLSIEGISADEVIQYTQFIIDVTLGLLGVSKIYNVSNPFPWMEMHELVSKSNFFEKNTTDYSFLNMKKAKELFNRRNGEKKNMEDMKNTENTPSSSDFSISSIKSFNF